MKKDMVIFKKTIAEELMRRGFELKGVAPSKKNPKYVVFFFEDTEDLHFALGEVIEAQK